jgi:hypothetical protein
MMSLPWGLAGVRKPPRNQPWGDGGASVATLLWGFGLRGELLEANCGVVWGGQKSVWWSPSGGMERRYR